MASKQLTATVRLNTTQAEKKLKNIARAIDSLNKCVGRQSNAYNQVNSALKTSESTTKKVKVATDQWAKSQKQVNTNIKSSNSVLGSISGKLKSIAATYLGIMGTRAIADTTDLLVGAQNRLNYVNGGDENLTQEAMDKMYVSSQKVRTSYQDMLGNVSKTMVLAGDAFGNNIDNAIRFQEIMAEAYAVGGASAAEMSTSMYQLTQALGSGVLAGDELRSVREGAPLAYQAIEEFAQGVLNTDESLKDLASQGKITSDIVVAAIMNAGSKLDTAFAQTKQTFGQTFDQIKNSAMYAFQPVMEMLTDALKKAIDGGMIQKFEQFFTTLSKAIMIVFRAIEIGVQWIADNWDWLKYIVLGAIGAIIMSLGTLALTAVTTALTSFLAFILNNPFNVWIISIALLVAYFVWLIDKTGSVCDAIYQVCYELASAIIALLAIVFLVFVATGKLIMSVPMMIALFVIGILALLLGAFAKWGAEIVGTAYGVGAYLGAVFDNIGIFFNNMIAVMQEGWWDFIADLCEDFDWLLNAINSVAGFFGKSTITVEGLRAKADNAASKITDYVDPMAAYNNAYGKGYAIGEGWQNKLNNFGEKIKNLGKDEGEEKTSLLDKIGNKLGLDFSGMGEFPTEGANPSSADDLLKNIAGDTGNISDSMSLTQEDLEYLRRIADMEWKKEYTTANITLDVTNNNNVNSDLDIFGIANKLSDVLYEEIDYVANGSYAY